MAGWQRKALLGALWLVAATNLLLVPALVNGFPFVYSDTGTYLRSVFAGFVPPDRPYWYGPFLRLSSFNGWSLRCTAAAQSLLSAAYI
jgi:hypothetical protein